jgi:hypothetical protein
MSQQQAAAPRPSGNYTLVGLAVGLALGIGLKMTGSPFGFGFGFGIAAGVLGGILLDPGEKRGKRIGAGVLLAAATLMSLYIGA